MAHDLHNYMAQLSAKMDAEYQRIRKTAAGDPGTAGDEGEENWAQLLREWLPPTYSVVTKGQLMDEKGRLSPQVDVIVLKPSYPSALHHKKKYLLAGVAAAFECKLTLRKSDVYAAVQTAAAIKRLAGPKEGTPYRELMCGPIYGLVAHAHSWGKNKSDIIDVIGAHLIVADRQNVNHPRETMDLVCVSNLATWVMSKECLRDPTYDIDGATRKKVDPKGGPVTSYMCHGGDYGPFSNDESPESFTPIGVFVSELLVKLAWEDLSLRDIARYFLGVEFSKSSSGMIRHWGMDVYSAALRSNLTPGRLSDVIEWNEWAFSIE